MDSLAGCGSSWDWRLGQISAGQLNRELWDWPDGVSSVWGYVCFTNDNGWPNQVSFVQPDNWNRIKDQVTVGNQIRWVPDGTGAEAAYPQAFSVIPLLPLRLVLGRFVERGEKGDDVAGFAGC